MEKLRTLAENKENPLALIGPLLLAMTVMSLWIFSKEVSSLLPAAGLIGLTITWLMSRNLAFWVSQGLIFIALATSIFLNPLEISWQVGFAFSLSLSLFITSLTQAETVDKGTAVDVALAARTQDITQANVCILSLQQQIEEKIMLLGVARDELLHAQQQERSWSDAVFESKQKLAKVEEALEDQILDIVDSPEYRRLNGAFTQLKDQFKEKDQVLIEARRQLFQEQECSSALAKELEEFRLYDIPSEVAELQAHYARLEQDYQHEISQLKAEIEGLEALILKENF